MTSSNYWTEREGPSDLIFLISVEKGFSQQVAFQMLEKMQGKFNETFKPEEVRGAKAMQYNSVFQSELKYLHTLHSVNNVDRVEVAINTVEGLKQEQLKNIQKLQERDGKLDSLVDKVDQLGDETQSLKKTVVSLERGEGSAQEAVLGRIEGEALHDTRVDSSHGLPALPLRLDRAARLQVRFFGVPLGELLSIDHKQLHRWKNFEQCGRA